MATLLSGTAFITGAAQGIGLYTAYAFAKHGIQRLALTDFNADVLATAVKELQAKYPDVEILQLQLDVRDGQQVKSAFEEVVKKFGRLDIAVNNAGIRGPIDNTHLVDEADYANLIQTNLNGVWRCEREELAIFMKQENKGIRHGRGVIINTASMFGLFGPPRGLPHTAYTAAKHGVVGMTKADAVQYGEHGIRINAICPGFAKTALTNSVLAQGDATPFAAEIQRCSMKRAGEVDEISDCIVFLASPMSSYMQGAVLVVDGGFTLT
ncbi:3-oxoacyl-reductase [Whalleya microplaca]|nr:3-oxoacyl-reductase [Whalleya microplaca]